jgi:hypothetical protein
MEGIGILLVILLFIIVCFISWKCSYTVASSFALFTSIYLVLFIILFTWFKPENETTVLGFQVLGAISLVYLVIWTWVVLYQMYR